MSAPQDEMESSPGSPPRFYRLTGKLADELGLKPGQIIRTWIETVLDASADSKQKIILNLKGQRVIAETHFPVSSHDSLLVKVRSTEHPIRLKLLDPSNLARSLSRTDLTRLLRDLGFRATESMRQIARTFLRHRVYLDRDLLKKAKKHWDTLRRDGGGLSEPRLNALLFLHVLDLPVSSEALRILGHLPETIRMRMEDLPVRPRAFQPGDPPGSLKETIQAQGVDFIRQLGRRPAQASSTFHARLLRQIRDGGPRVDEHRTLLAQLLSLALASIASDSKVHLQVPFQEEGSLRVCYLCYEEPGNDRETWDLRGFTRFSGLGNLGFEITRTPDDFRVKWITPSSSVLDQLKQHAAAFKKRFHNGEAEVKMEWEQSEPENVFPFEDLQHGVRSETFSGIVNYQA